MKILLITFLMVSIIGCIKSGCDRDSSNPQNSNCSKYNDPAGDVKSEKGEVVSSPSTSPISNSESPTNFVNPPTLPVGGLVTIQKLGSISGSNSNSPYICGLTVVGTDLYYFTTDLYWQVKVNKLITTSPVSSQAYCTIAIANRGCGASDSNAFYFSNDSNPTDISKYNLSDCSSAGTIITNTSFHGSVPDLKFDGTNFFSYGGNVAGIKLTANGVFDLGFSNVSLNQKTLSWSYVESIAVSSNYFWVLVFDSVESRHFLWKLDKSGVAISWGRIPYSFAKNNSGIGSFMTSLSETQIYIMKPNTSTDNIYDLYQITLENF